MLFNVQRLLSERGIRRIYSTYPKRAADLGPGAELTEYHPLSSHLGKLSLLGAKPDSFIVTVELFAVFAGMSFLCVPLPFFRNWLSRLLDPGGLLSAIRDSDFLLFSGGGYLTDLGTLEARACLLTGVLGILLGKRIYFSGQGVGPLHNPVTRALLGFVARRAGRILLRDQDASKCLLTGMDIDENIIRESGDDALTLPLSAQEPATSRINGRKILGIHLRLTPFGSQSAQIIERTKRIFTPLLEEGWQLRFYKFASQSSWEGDIYSRLTRDMEDDVFSIVQTDDPGEIRRSIGECTVCIGMAYHFLLFALAESVPAIGLYSGSYYRQKLHGLYKWYDRQDWVFDQAQCEREDMVNIIRTMETEHNHLSRQLSERTSQLSKSYLGEMNDMICLAMEEQSDNK